MPPPRYPDALALVKGKVKRAKRPKDSVPSCLKWHGGKHYLATRLVALMPTHTHYVEPYCGALHTMFAKNPEGISEVANDKYGELTRFWTVLQGGKSFAQFARLCEATPFSQAEWSNAELEFAEWPDYDPNIHSDVVRAWKFFIWCRMSLAGRMDSFTGITKTRTRRGMNAEVSAWLNTVERLAEVHARLKRILITCEEAVICIGRNDDKKTLFYCDPPYLHETRQDKEVYAEEMTWEQHEGLLYALSMIRGRFLLSGYRSKLYDKWAKQNGWRRADFEIANHASGAEVKKRMTECVWMNF